MNRPKRCVIVSIAEQYLAALSLLGVPIWDVGMAFDLVLSR
jgi:hypothetical protein